MKRAAILLLAILTSACATIPERVPEQRSVIAFDFSDYTQQGFMFTPQGYQGAYESVGMINMTISPQARRSSNQTDASQLPSDKYLIGEWIVDRITTDQLVEAAYQEAQAMGADAIIDFSIVGSSRSPATGLRIPEYTMSGFAIRRVAE